MIRLDGCVGCNEYVYRPGEEKLVYCPRVKSDGTLCLHPRFDQNGKPHEVRTACNCVVLCVCIKLMSFARLFVESILFSP